MHNTWWVTRPKRYLASVPRALASLALAVGTKWQTPNKSTEMLIEEALESSGVKRVGTRRDRGGGGARTYRSWLKSLGLVFMDDEDQLQLTLAGQDLLSGDNPIPIIRKQVLDFQYPSAWSIKGASAVHPRFRIHPFRFLLTLLGDPRLEGYLTQSEDIAKIVIAYGETPESLDDVVNRILRLRQYGDASLDNDYVEKFTTKRQGHTDIEKLFANHNDVANTIGNWLEYAQLIYRENGTWKLNPATEDITTAIIGKPARFIDRPEDEEYFQRRYGIGLKRKKDLRDLTQSRTVTKRMIEQRNLNVALLTLASKHLITDINADVIRQLATKAGTTTRTAERFLRKKYPHGASSIFLSEYADMAIQSRHRAREFEVATTEIFRQVFGYDAYHIAAGGIVPDIYIESHTDHYCAILDNKAYKDGYSISNDHYNRMVYDYIPDVAQYRPTQTDYDLAFFSYIATEFKDTVDKQLHRIEHETHIPGSVVTSSHIIRMVELSEEKPFTHTALRNLFSLGRAITVADIQRAHAL